MERYHRLLFCVIAVCLAFWLISCAGSSGDDDESCAEPTLDIAVCDPSGRGAGYFSLTIDNDFFPLAVGDELVLEGEDDGETIRVEITVLDETETVAGVTTRVVEEAEYEDGELVEVSRNFYAQAEDGTVCYFGEDVDDYEDGEIVSHEGQWRAGENGSLPGIMMPAQPAVDMTFYQEYAPGLAEDMSTIVSTGDTIDVPAGVFSDTLTAEDCNPLEGAETDEKVYVSGIGLAVDEEAELVSALEAVN